MNKPVQLNSILFCMLVAGVTHALEDMSDDQLGTVSGADGVSAVFTTPTTGIQLGDVSWQLDQGVTSVGAVTVSPAASATAKTVTLSPIGVNGAASSVPVALTSHIDVGATVGGVPRVSIASDWTRSRLQIANFQLDTTNSFGTLALDTSGSAYLSSENGIFGSNSSAGINITGGQLYFRQGAVGQPELLLDNLRLVASMNGGRFGVDSQGIVLSAPVFNLDLGFDIKYQGSVSSNYFTADSNDAPMLMYGWQGGLTNWETRIKAGGVWYTPTGNATYDQGNRSQGINLSMHWDYDPAFALIVGEIGASRRTQLRFDNWTKLPGATYAFDMPNLTLDVVNAGQGPGGLCWGANWDGPANTCNTQNGGKARFVELGPDKDALAAVIRDAKLLSYSSGVKLLDDINADGDYVDTVGGVSETQSFKWSLIYTYGNIDGNIYLYPGGKSGGQYGLHGDVVLTAQSLGGWSDNAHFMIGDTDKGLAIGWMNANWLIALDDLFVSMLSSGIELETLTKARINFKGQFGGGEIPNMASYVRGFDLDVNLEATALRLQISPPPSGQSYMGYSGFVRIGDTNVSSFSGATGGATVLTANGVGGCASAAGCYFDDGSYISMSEQNRPNVDVRFANITGDIGIQNGRFDLVSDAETPVGVPAKLILSQEMVIGATNAAASCPGGACQALRINRVEFNDQNLGQIAMPGGLIGVSLALKPQVP